MSADPSCDRCRRPLRTSYRAADGATRCVRCFVRQRYVLRRSLFTALLVGSVLTGINQGDRLLRADVTPGILFKVGLTYCVPFAVSTSGALGAARVQYNTA